MKTKSPYSVLTPAEQPAPAGQSYWNALISNGLPGLEIISAPQALVSKQQPTGADAETCSPSSGASTISRLWNSPLLNLTAMNALDEIDETYLVTTLDVPALYRSKQIIQTLPV